MTAGDRTAIQQIVQRTLLSQQAGKGTGGAPSRGRRSKAGKQIREDFRAQIARRKAKSIYAACKEKGHWAGDPECPKTKKEVGSNGTMLASSVENENGQDEDSPCLFFR